MATVLLIDDDEDLLEACTPAIAARGHAVRVAHSAKEARELLLKHGCPDAVVLDVMMEKLDSGFDLAREIHQQFPGLRMIMLTSLHKATDLGLHFEPDETWLPVTKFLDKPVDPAVLADEIETLAAR